MATCMSRMAGSSYVNLKGWFVGIGCLRLSLTKDVFVKKKLASWLRAIGSSQLSDHLTFRSIALFARIIAVESHCVFELIE